MIDIVREIEATQREVGSGRLGDSDARAVQLTRTYDAPIDDVWDALTNPDRIGRWFLPISGDYRIGGRYQFEGNAGGKIVSCDRPERLKVTWEMGDPSGPASEVEVRLTRAGEGTTLRLEHTAIVPAEFWDQYGPGAVGVGWDGGMLGLSLHLRGESIADPIAWQISQEGLDFSTRCSVAWGAANAASGADQTVVATGVANTTAFYTSVPDEI